MYTILIVLYFINYKNSTKHTFTFKILRKLKYKQYHTLKEILLFECNNVGGIGDKLLFLW